MSTRLFRASTLFVLGSVATLALGCSADSGSAPPSSASEQDVGSIGLKLQLASGATLSSVSYTISGPNGFARSGTIDASHSTTVSSTIGGLPAGHGFSITLDGTASDSGHCAGSASFDIAARMTTAVSVHLACHEAARTGSVLVNGVLNTCPTADGISALPAEVLVGSSMALSAAAHDSDAGPAAIAYHWTTTGGTLSAPDTQNPSLRCTTAGTFTVSFTATDGDCTDTASATVTCTAAAGGSIATMDLSRYVRVARYALPEPTRTTPPDGTSLLAQEASAVTYDWDTDTLFVVGDGGTSVVQVSKTGALIDSMTLAAGSSPQGTTFYDTEGVAYVGGGKFVLNEERDRQVNLFTYVAGATLHRADVKTVKLGTSIGNIGLEGVTFDPANGHYIFVKEKDPRGIFDTGIDFAAGTASNGSPTTDESVNLFDPALVSTLDFSDVFALSNLPTLAGDPTFNQLLIISQESGKIVQVDRSGSVKHTLSIVADASDTISVPDMTMEGLTMDRSGILYVVNENGGGDLNHPQLWVYAPSTAADLAPTAVSLTGAVTTLPENTSSTSSVHLADIVVTDDGLGDNNLSVSGPDAGSFEIVGTALFLKAGTTLNAATKPSYSVTVSVDDMTVGATPDASTSYTLAITTATSGAITLAITEVAPWSSGNSPLASDWFELTNFGTSAVSLTGWTMDDNSNSFAVSVPLNGVASIAPGQSVIFIETASASELAAKSQSFVNLWYGGTAPAGLQIGSYSGSGVGLSTGGDAVNVFDNGGAIHAAISFGPSPSGTPLPTFDNSAGLDSVAITSLSVVGQHGAFVAASDATEIGSPGTVGGGATPIVGITASDALASETGSDPGAFHFTRSGSTTAALTVVYSIATGTGQATSGDYTPALSGSQVIPAGAASVDVTITPVDDALVEGAETLTLTLSDTGNYDVGADASATVTIQDNDAANLAPTAVTLQNTVPSLSEAADVSSHVRLADISVTDDGLGTNALSLSGTDAASFELVGSQLFLRAGTALSHTSK
ncbi:MAG TPA: SdiA-regulated domain-containing protein, partial [Polyangia bacterium]|nr:SdiA-regulated domain-containing protein [Polyangia bacterium]